MSARGKNLLLVVVLLVASGLAAGVIAISATGGSDAAPSALRGAADTETLLRGIPQRGNALGKAGAPVTIVEYADFQCPYCAQWALQTFPAIVEEYVRPGKARIVFQGLAFLGPDSATALQTALAAGVQNRLWNVSELLYHNQGAENAGWVTSDLLEQIGSSVKGLDGERMLDERTSSEVAAAVADAQASANAAGVTSTPAFAIGRTGGPAARVDGARPTDEFRDLLDSLLER